MQSWNQIFNHDCPHEQLDTYLLRDMKTKVANFLHTIWQYIICLWDFFELLFCFFCVIWILVRMPFQCQLSVAANDNQNLYLPSNKILKCVSTGSSLRWYNFLSMHFCYYNINHYYSITLHWKTIPLGAISMSYPMAITYKGTFASKVSWWSEAVGYEWCNIIW